MSIDRKMLHIDRSQVLKKIELGIALSIKYVSINEFEIGSPANQLFAIVANNWCCDNSLPREFPFGGGASVVIFLT